MAGVRFKCTQSGVVTGTTEKTLMQVFCAANHAAMIEEISISFNGVVNTNEPILVQVARQTTAGTLTAGAPVKDPDDAAEALQTDYAHTATAEPTKGDVLMHEYVHPQSGFIWQAPFGSKIKIGGGDRLGVIVTAPNSVSAAVRVVGEE